MALRAEPTKPLPITPIITGFQRRATYLKVQASRVFLCRRIALRTQAAPPGRKHRLSWYWGNPPHQQLPVHLPSLRAIFRRKLPLNVISSSVIFHVLLAPATKGIIVGIVGSTIPRKDAATGIAFFFVTVNNIF